MTILLPTYERATYLALAIESALAQTYGDFVLSIGDNSRNDETEAIVRRFDDPRIHYVRHPENLGAQGNWLALVAAADTPLVATLHDDDVWHEDLLATLVPPMLDDPTLGMAFADFGLIDEDGAPLRDLTAELSHLTHRDRLAPGLQSLDHDDAMRLVAVWNAPQPAICAVLRRDLLRGIDFPDEIAPIYDIWTSYQFAQKGGGFWYAATRLSDYRWHRGSLTAGGPHRAEDEIFGRIVADHAGSLTASEVGDHWATIRWGRAVQMMRSGREHRSASRREFLASADRIGGLRRIAAAAAGRWDLAWEGLRIVQWILDVAVAAETSARSIRPQLRAVRERQSG